MLRGLFSKCGRWASHRGGSLLGKHRRQGVQASGAAAVGSVVAAPGLDSYGARAQLIRSMWHLPRSGIESVSPALAGGSFFFFFFFTTEPPGKPSDLIFQAI